MNSLDLTPFYRSSIGFDKLDPLIASSLNSTTALTSFPLYNIELLDENEYEISLAVAGFDSNDIDISVEKGVLTVRGEISDDERGNYLHQGILSRKFERKFNLADFIEVTDANLHNGLLTIRLFKEVPEAMQPKTIEISSGNRNLHAAAA